MKKKFRCGENGSEILTVEKVKDDLGKKVDLKIHPRLPQLPFFLLIVAPRKSGKTNLLLDMLLSRHKYRQKFDLIVVWSRTFYHDKKWENINLPGKEFVFEKYDEDDITEIIDALSEASKTSCINALFIFDDMINDKIMSPYKMGALDLCATRGRHINLSVIVITQQYMKVSPPARNNATNTAIFRIRNGDEIEKIVRENREGLTSDQFESMMLETTNKPYQFLHINNQAADPKERFYKNWGDLIPIGEGCGDANNKKN